MDEKGRLVPDALPIRFRITGNGEIIATANANPSGMESFQKPGHKTFQGKCLAIVRPKGNAGKIILRAEAEGLAAGEAVIETR